MDGNLAIKYNVLENGDIVDMSRASVVHNITLGRLVKSLEKVVEKSCEVLREQSFRWKEDTAAYRMPDISIACDISSANGVDLDSIPWFIAEVLSESTEVIDRNEKMRLYAKIGIQEYWIVEPVIRKIERYKNIDGTMQLIDVIGEDVKNVSFLTKDKMIDISNVWYSILE
jgi:Uma2 family endonuclease